MDNEENNQPRLTDEEVWLRAYCAAIAGGHDDEYLALLAEKTVKDFKERFRKND